MSNPHHIGVQTLEHVLDRCHVDIDGCWLWRLGTMHKGGVIPMINISHGHPDPALAGKRMATRRAVWLLQGRKIDGGHVVYSSCGEPLCCNPGHIKAGPRKHAVRAAVRAGRLNTPRRRAAQIANGRALRRLTDEQTRAVLSSDESASALARRYGVSRQLITGIRTRSRYRATVIGADVFSLAQHMSLPTIQIKRAA